MWKWQDCEFTDAEMARAAGVRVWYLWEYDSFGFANDRDPPQALSIYLSRAAAESALQELTARETPFLEYSIHETDLPALMTSNRNSAERRLIRRLLDQLPLVPER